MTAGLVFPKAVLERTPPVAQIQQHPPKTQYKSVDGVRKQVAERLAGAGGEELLSTGEVAALLGVSRQHVVDLCDAGKLACAWPGKHRRIRRRDAEMIAAGARRASRDQTRLLLLAYVVAGRVVADPDRALTLARENLRRIRASTARGAAQVWMREWERLLDGPLADLLAALTSPSPRARELRQNNPFAGLLSEQERRQVLATERATR